MEETIRARAQVPVEDTWDLSVIFPSDSAWRDALEAFRKDAEKVSAYRGRLGESAGTLLEFLRLWDSLEERMWMVCGYANCRGDENTGDSAGQAMRGEASGAAAELDEAGAFQRPEILEIPPETLERFFREEPALEEYRRPLERISRMRAHTLPTAEEQLLSGVAELAEAPDTVSSILQNSALHFPDAMDSEGHAHALTQGSYIPMLLGEDRTLRKNAFTAYYGVLDTFSGVCASLLDAQMKNLRFFARARHYDSALEAALYEHEVPTEVYRNLIRAVNDNLEPMYRYVRLRKRLLGLDEVHMYDVYAPLVSDCQRDISFPEAKETVLEALSVLGEDYTALLRRGFGERWIDVYENEGKRSGAYSTDFARPHPFVLLNHKNNLESVFTLAHEMGHALHSCYSDKSQPWCQSDYVIFVAEVASTCNEVLLMEYLLGKTTDRKQRAYLINYFLDQFKGTLYRQTMFCEFELEMGKLSEEGRTLTADTLNERYLALNRRYFGEDMVSDPEIRLEWARIPHFFYNYYVFQYATGFSAAVAIARRILREGAPAVADYKKFLSGGCSADPISLLKLAGVDMCSPKPVADALSLFGELVDEMEALTKE